MKLKNANLMTFNKLTENKRIFCFAAGKLVQRIFGMYKDLRIEDRIVNYVDNNTALAHTKSLLNGKEIEIITLNEMLQKIRRDDIILIGTFRFKEVIDQLDSISAIKANDCYILKFLMEDFDNFPIEKPCFPKQAKIPKKIHYFWFGGNALGDLEKRCIDSWQKYCPDYEIIRWDENNYDYKKNRYAKEAYEKGKYAFVSDYARLDVVYNEGGIYFDTDVEIIKPIDDLLGYDGFMGFETNSLINSGSGIGGVAGLELFRALRDAYNSFSFALDKGRYNDLTNVYIQSKELKSYGLALNNSFQVINNIAFFPAEFFSPISYLSGNSYVSSNTFSIHRFSSTWQTTDSTDYRMNQQKYINDIIKRIKNG